MEISGLYFPFFFPKPVKRGREVGEEVGGIGKVGNLLYSFIYLLKGGKRDRASPLVAIYFTS